MFSHSKPFCLNLARKVEKISGYVLNNLFSEGLGQGFRFPIRFIPWWENFAYLSCPAFFLAWYA
jgi:hypothetical protein